MARYKVLKSVAHSVAHSFASLMNYQANDYVMSHLLARAREVGEDTLTVDLVSGVATPALLLTPPIAASVQRYWEWFPQLVASHETSMERIAEARLLVTFDLGRRTTNRGGLVVGSPYTSRAEIKDDRGKSWAAEIRDWWFPEPFSGSVRGSASRINWLLRRLQNLARSGYRALRVGLMRPN